MEEAPGFQLGMCALTWVFMHTGVQVCWGLLSIMYLCLLWLRSRVGKSLKNSSKKQTPYTYSFIYLLLSLQVGFSPIKRSLQPCKTLHDAHKRHMKAFVHIQNLTSESFLGVLLPSLTCFLHLLFDSDSDLCFLYTDTSLSQW